MLKRELMLLKKKNFKTKCAYFTFFNSIKKKFFNLSTLIYKISKFFKIYLLFY